MSFSDDNPGHKIETEEQARNWILELIEDLRVAREMCNIVYPKSQEIAVSLQRKNYTTFMVKHGAALGSIMALHRCGKLSDYAYNELRQKVLDMLAPTIIKA